MPKTSLNVSLHGFSGIGNHMCTCVHDYMAVNVKVTLRSMEKMNFNRWALAITAVPTTLTSRFPTTGYTRML